MHRGLICSRSSYIACRVYGSVAVNTSAYDGILGVARAAVAATSGGDVIIGDAGHHHSGSDDGDDDDCAPGAPHSAGGGGDAGSRVFAWPGTALDSLLGCS